MARILFKICTLSTLIILGLLLFSCSDDDSRGGIDAEQVGDTCDTPDSCYDEIDHEDILGEVICLDRVENGYCTHTCQTDDDCCSVEGECHTDLPQVCAPLESSPNKHCMVTCEDVEAEDFCETNVHFEFQCRSTGGGSENRKVCLPN